MRASSADASYVVTYSSRRSSRAEKADVEEMVMKMLSMLRAACSALPPSARVDQSLHDGRSEHVVRFISAKQQALHLHAPICSSTKLLNCHSLLLSLFVRRFGGTVLPCGKVGRMPKRKSCGSRPVERHQHGLPRFAARPRHSSFVIPRTGGIDGETV